MPEEPKAPESTEETAVAEQPAGPSAPVAATPEPTSKLSWFRTKKILRVPLFTLGIVFLVLGGSAAAYFGVIVPNRPENVLKSAISNTAEQRKVKFDGKLTYESTDPEADLKAVNVTFNGEADADKNGFQSAFEVTASGIKVPFEARFVDKSIFLKVGDLSSVKGVAQAAAPQAASAVDAISNKLSNQWLEIDETLLKQAGGSCALDTSFAFTKQDIDLLAKRYEEAPFATTKSTARDTVNGRSAYKYELDINGEKSADYAKGLEELSVVKKLRECGDGQDSLGADKLTSNNESLPVTLWVDRGSKRIVKIATQSTPADEEKERAKFSLEITFSYGEANVTSPEGAKPIMEVLGDFSQLFGGMMGAGSSMPRTTSTGMSAECEAELRTSINNPTFEPSRVCLEEFSQ